MARSFQMGCCFTVPRSNWEPTNKGSTFALTSLPYVGASGTHNSTLVISRAITMWRSFVENKGQNITI